MNSGHTKRINEANNRTASTHVIYDTKVSSKCSGGIPSQILLSQRRSPISLSINTFLDIL